MRQQIFCEDRHKDFATDRHEAGGSELPLVSCAGGGVKTGVTYVAPTVRDLGSLKRKIKHPSKYRGNVGSKGFEDLRQNPFRADV